MDLTFTKCTLKHLDLLSQISRQTFFDAFEKDNKPDDFKTYLDAAFSKKQIAIELKNPDTSFYFVYLDSEVIGYFKLNEKETQNEKMDVPSIELERLYVLLQFQNRQFGKHILYKIIAIAKSKDLLLVWLGVWQKNFHAIRFYEKYGFKKFKTHDFMVGTDKQTDWVMTLQLD